MAGRLQESRFDADDLGRVASAVDLVLASARAAQLMAAVEALVPVDALTVWPAAGAAGRPWHLARGDAPDPLGHALVTSGRDGRREYQLVAWRRASSAAFGGRDRVLLQAVAPIVARVLRRHGARGGRALTSALEGRLERAGAGSELGATRARVGTLTPRERRVATLVARGRSNGEVAYELGVSLHTIKQHLKSAFKKLDVRGRTELALLLVQRGEVAS